MKHNTAKHNIIKIIIRISEEQTGKARQKKTIENSRIG
jgi:hypothetical protein